MRNNKVLWRITLMCTASLQMAAIGMSPMLSSMAKAFPEASTQTIQFVMTLPALVVAVMGFVFAFLSDRIPNNVLTGAGCLIAVVMSLGAAFFHPSLGILYFWSIILGVANGLAANGQSVLVNKLFNEKEKPGVLGFQTFAASIGAMIMTFVGGFLTDISWNLGYLAYLIGIPGAVCCFFLLPNVIRPLERTKEFAPEAQENAPGSAESQGKLKITQMILPFLAAFIGNLTFNISGTNLSMFVEAEKLGTAAQAGTAATIMLLVGGLAGLAFGLLYKRIKAHLVTLGMLLLTAGYVIVFFTRSYAVLIVACVVFCGAISFIMSCLTMYCFRIGRKDTALAIALLLSGAHAGVLISPVVTNISAAVFGTEDVKYRFLFGAILAGVTAVVAAVYIILKARKGKNEKTEKA